jgi:hypothetical protein
MRPAWIAAGLAMAVETASLVLLDSTDVAPSGLLTWGALHIAASATAAAALPRLLPKHLQHAAQHATLLFFLFCVLVPLFGMAGVAFMLVPILSRQQVAAPADRIHLYRRPSEPERCDATAERGRRFGGAGGLVNVLKHGSDRQDRLCALIATQSLEDRCAGTVLRLGVRDGDDDVRLLAYSLLMKKQKALEVRLSEGQKVLDTAAEPPQRFAVHLAMAHHFWDLQQLTPDSAAAALWRDQSLHHAQAGLAIEPSSADLQMLCGMIALRARQIDCAERAFLAAAGNGIAAATLAPYGAEIAFYRRAAGDIAGAVQVPPLFGAPLEQPQLTPTALPALATSERELSHASA